MKLVFVYNADSGFFNTLTDVAHKLISPQTYECQLCAITHSAFKEHDEWKHYIENLDVQTEFLHRDEFASRHDFNHAELPAIFQEINGELKLCVATDDLSSSHSIDDLKKLITEKCL